MTKWISAAVLAAFAASPGVAEMMVKDAYARSSSPKAKAGAAFMVLHNMGQTDDRLIAASSPASKRVELHTHIENDDGVMLMREVESGFVVPAGETHALKRGGDHVMFMGLTASWTHGDLIPVTFVFEKAGEITMDVPVDLERKPDHGGHDHADHSN